MPIKKAIEDFQYDPENFNFEDFRKSLLTEYTTDETAWRAAVAQRDATITETAANLQKAQSKAWELLQQAPVDKAGESDEPDENDMDALRARVFTTVERK